MATIFAKPIGLSGVEIGSLDVTLCGYGSRSPVARGAGGENGVFMDAELKGIEATGPGNTYSITLIGNDEIAPAGTYYTITFRDNNGDILQCNAYLFLDDNTYDLANTDPYDPSLPPPPLPPLIIPQLLIVQPQYAPSFPGDKFTAWQITIDQDIPGATLSGIIPGNLYTFIIRQDATGGHLFQFPTGPLPYGTRNVTEVCMEPNSTTVQTFVADSNTILWPIGPGTWYL